MTHKTFHKVAGELFSSLLLPFGFTSHGSRHVFCYRKVGDDVYHIISPSMGRSGTWYDILVFPHSPHIDPQFERRFPDRLGVPTDSWSYLSEYEGVNLRQQQFNCKHEENLRNRFASTVAPLLVNVALPYLDQFKTVSDIVPAIRHSSFLGFALHYLGRRAEAEVKLRAERDRLKLLGSSDPEVVELLQHVERLLV